MHYDLQRKTALAFTDGQTELATALHEASGHVDRAIAVLTREDS